MSMRQPRPEPREGDPRVRVPLAGQVHVHRFGHGASSARMLGDVVAAANAAPDRLVVVGYDQPSMEQLAELATVLDLHPLVVEDLINAGQRPKAERYDDVLFVVTRSAEYRDDVEEVVFSEFHTLTSGNVVIVLCQRRPQNMPWDPADLRIPEALVPFGTEAVIYALLDTVVDGYARVLRGLDVDTEQIEKQVFTGDPKVTERIYRLSQEVIDLQHAANPLVEVVSSLRRGFGKYAVPDELQTHLQDVADHLSRVSTRILGLRETLAQILNVNATLVTQRQNEDMKKISGWAAILFAPTLIGAIYGMNFDVMPELHWSFGYPLAVGAMLALGVGLWFMFRWKKWM